MPNTYRCYFTDESDRIRSYEQIDCSDDATAVLKVDELLATSRYNSAELWQGRRLVGRWPADSANGVVKQHIESEHQIESKQSA
jgi:hypothetical protein